jgi:hypothetical protein
MTFAISHLKFHGNNGCVDKSHRINLTYSEIFANFENFEFLEFFDRVQKKNVWDLYGEIFTIIRNN